jgi:hypothetical protein
MIHDAPASEPARASWFDGKLLQRGSFWKQLGWLPSKIPRQ